MWFDERVQLRSLSLKTQHHRPGRKIGPICISKKRLLNFVFNSVVKADYAIDQPLRVGFVGSHGENKALLRIFYPKPI